MLMWRRRTAGRSPTRRKSLIGEVDKNMGGKLLLAFGLHGEELGIFAVLYHGLSRMALYTHTQLLLGQCYSFIKPQFNQFVHIQLTCGQDGQQRR